MNVLVAVPWDQETGGVALVVGHLATYLQQHGHTVWFLHPAECRFPRARVTMWGFPGYQTNLRSPVSPHTARAAIAYAITFPYTLLVLLWLIIRHRIDVVNVHFPSAMFGYFAVCRQFIGKLRLVVSIHGTDLLEPAGAPKSLDLLTRFLLRSADALVAPSLAFASQCNIPTGLRSPVHVIHNGVDLAEFSARQERQERTILAIASLDQWKGIDILIRAFARLCAEHEGLRLLIAGDGPDRSALALLAVDLGVADDVCFLGYVDRPTVARLLATCTVFVLPSRSESFGIVVAEALAASAPVVASRVGGVPEILDDGTYGVLVPSEDVRALADALTHVLGDAHFRKTLSQRGPTRVASAFRREFTGERYLALFQRII